jgi:outer membrane protein assembly factor BamE
MRIILIPVSLLLASCSNFSNYLPTFTPHKIEIRQGNLITQDMRARIKLGMSEAQVKAALGAPLIADAYHAGRWDYLYRLDKQGKTEVDQRLTLYFEEGALARIVDVTPLLPSPVPIQEMKDEN